MGTAVFLEVVHTVIRLDVADEAMDAFAPVRRFFRHHVVSEPATSPHFAVEVRPYAASAAATALEHGTPWVIRRSSAAAFNFDARRLVSGDRVVYANEHTVLDAPVRAAGHGDRFVVHVSAPSTFQVVDFLRDLVLRAEEDTGTVILHAAGVTTGGEAVVIAGRKGAGKTTTLLALLADPSTSYFTGDKVFLGVDDGRLVVHPWRDWPYVGVGTMRLHGWLARWATRDLGIDLDALSPRDKLLLDPDEFEIALGGGFKPDPQPLGTIVFPEVRPDEPCRVEVVTDEAERWALLNQIVERTCDTTFFGWQTYLVPDYAAFFAGLSALRPRFDGVRVVRVTGSIVPGIAGDVLA